MPKTKTEKKEWSGMPTSEAELKQIKAAIDATYQSYSVLETERAQLKDIFLDINTKTGIPRRVFNFLAKSNYFGNAQETISKNSQLEEAYEAVEKVSFE